MGKEIKEYGGGKRGRKGVREREGEREFWKIKQEGESPKIGYIMPRINLRIHVSFFK